MMFAHPYALLALLVLPIAAFAWVRGLRASRRRAMLVSRLAGPSPRNFPAGVMCLAIACAIVAAAQPRWGTHASQLSRAGSDLVVVMDVSRSMDSTDVAPSRLEAAKKAINATIDELGTSRVGLVLFAGTARLRFPLTSDFQAARQVVSSLQTNQFVGQGGTSTALGLDEAVKAFDLSKPGGRAVLLLTDGDDLGADPSAAATKLRAAGIDLMVAGIGTTAGGPVPLTDPTTGRVTTKLGADGKPIVTRLGETFLRAVAGAAGGRYLGSDMSAVAGLVAGHLSALQSVQFERQATTVPVERYEWFAAAALALIVAGAIGERWRPPRLGPARLLAAITSVLLVSGCATSAYQSTEAGRAALKRGDTEAAITDFSAARDTLPNDSRANLNLAAALNAAGRFDEALAAARRATTDSDAVVRAAAYASMGHQDFGAQRLTDALADFKLALLSNPADSASRHDYEVVLALLSPAAQQPPGQQGNPQSGSPQGQDQQPQGGQQGQQSDSGGPTGGGQDQQQQPGGQQQPQQGGQQTGPSNPTGGGQQSSRDIERQLQQIDGQVQGILNQSNNQPTPDQALQILRLLQQRSQIAAGLSASSGASNPNDY